MFPEMIVILFVLAFIVPNFYAVSDIVRNVIKVIPGIIGLMYSAVKVDRNVFNRGLTLSFSLTLCMCFSMVYNQNADPAEILWIWSYMGLSMILYQFTLRPMIMQIVFYCVALYFVFLALQANVNAVDIANNLIVNTISTFCIFALFIYLLSNYRIGKARIPYLPILLILFISLWTATRSAILCMGWLFLWSFFFNFKGKSIHFGQVLVVIAVISLMIYFYNNLYSHFGANLMAKLDRQGVESARTGIWRDYIEATFGSHGNLLFGPSYLNPTYGNFHQYSGNAHNAFLMLHSRYGLVGFIIVIYNLIIAIAKMIKKQELFLLLLLSLIIIRSMFDWTAFPGAYDIIFYFFLIYATTNVSRNGLISCN